MISHTYSPGHHRREVCYRADDIHGPYEKQVILESEFGETFPQEIKEKSVTDILYGVLLMMCKSGKSTMEIKTYIVVLIYYYINKIT